MKNDLCGPLAFAVIRGVCTLVLAWLSGLTTIPPALTGTAMTFGIVMAGFSATQRNMLFSMRGSRVIRRANKNNQMVRVWFYMAYNTFVGIAITLYSFLGFFSGTNLIFNSVWITVLGALVFLALGFLLSSEIILWRVLRQHLDKRSG